MKSYAPAAAFGLALGASGAAILRARDDPYDENGDTHVEISDDKINYGDNPPWTAFDEIKNKCLSTGCNSDVSIEAPSRILNNDGYSGFDTVTIKMAVEGSFNDEGEKGDLDDLVELVKTVVANSQYDKDNDVEYTTGSGCGSGSSGVTPCDPGETETMDQYKATNFINVRVENDDDGLTADMSVSVSIEDTESDSGACDDLATIGSAVGGAISGVAGGLFSLYGLTC